MYSAPKRYILLSIFSYYLITDSAKLRILLLKSPAPVAEPPPPQI
jgi:hypothetical protein